MSRIRERITYANVASTIALFLALGGATAFAAVNLGKNSVGTRELKPNAVKTGQLAKNAVRTGKIAREAVRAGKIDKGAIVTDRLRNGAVTGAKLDNGAVGTGKLAQLAVTTGKLGNESVQTGKIGSGAITTGKLADKSVTGPKINEATLGTVPSAANADKVGGHSTVCPTGMKAVVGFCFDATARPSANWPTAFDDCRLEGTMLPGVGELAAAAAALGNVASGNGEWTDSFSFVEGATPNTLALGVNDEGGVLSHGITASLPYRCMTPLVR